LRHVREEGGPYRSSILHKASIEYSLRTEREGERGEQKEEGEESVGGEGEGAKDVDLLDGVELSIYR
jgi:hypothetical protein